MSEQRQTIHIRIRDLRRQRSLTQEELAEALGLSRQSINAMEAGRCLPSLPVALQIASYFSVPLNAVFTFPDGTEQLLTNSKEVNPMATPIPWSPLKEMREALDELMDESIGWQAASQSTGPAMNIWQTEDRVVVEAALPGFRTEDLAIEVGEDFLMLAGDLPEDPADRAYYRREFMLRPFRRTVSLPAIVRVKEAEAEMKNGILTVTLAKVVEEKPKTARISIKSLD